jgi:transposase
MGEFGQKFVVKYFSLKGWGNKKITAELESTFQRCALSRATVKRWLRYFNSGDLSCADLPRRGRPLTSLGSVIEKFLEKHPFASSKVVSRHIDVSASTVKEIMTRELGLKKYTRRWVPHELSEDQKKFRVDQSRMPLDILQLYAEHNFEGIVTDHESWFRCSTYSDSTFAASAEDVIPRTKQNMSAKKTMIMIFFTSNRLLVLNSLSKGTKFNQYYFIDAGLTELYSEKARIARRKCVPAFSVHIDNLMYHNGAKITEKLGKKHITQAPHPSYSPGLSPCDFSLSGM